MDYRGSKSIFVPSCLRLLFELFMDTSEKMSIELDTESFLRKLDKVKNLVRLDAYKYGKTQPRIVVTKPE